jgi:hypothetical protein
MRDTSNCVPQIPCFKISCLVGHSAAGWKMSTVWKGSSNARPAMARECPHEHGERIIFCTEENVCTGKPDAPCIPSATSSAFALRSCSRGRSRANISRNGGSRCARALPNRAETPAERQDPFHFKTEQAYLKSIARGRALNSCQRLIHIQLFIDLDGFVDGIWWMLLFLLCG